MKRNIFTTKLYWIYIGIALFVTVNLCFFLPFAQCKHTIVTYSDNSFDFSYMRRIHLNNTYHNTDTMQGDVFLDDVYWRKTQCGEYIVVNGRYDMQEGTEGENIIHNMSLSINEQCATYYDVLMKRESSFYESYPMNIFPRLNHDSLSYDSAYVYEGDDWILYSSEPLKEVVSMPMPIFVNQNFYKAVFLFGCVFIINIGSLIILGGRKVKNNTELMDLIMEIRDTFPSESKEKGKKQFSAHISGGAYLNLIWIGILFIFQLIPSVITTLVNGAWGLMHTMILFALFAIACIVFSVIKRMHESLLIIYKTKNTFDEEICRMMSFSLPEYRTTGKWGNFNMFLRISGLLYVTGHLEEARIILEKSWQIIRPKELEQHMLYLIMLSKMDVVFEENDKIIENLSLIENLLMRYELERKVQTKLFKKINYQYKMLQLEIEKKWSELLELTEKVKKELSDQVEILGITIIQYRASNETGSADFEDSYRMMLQIMAPKWLEII